MFSIESIFGDETIGSVAVPLVDDAQAVNDEAANCKTVLQFNGSADDEDDADVELIFWHCGPVPQYVGSPTPLLSPPAKPFDPDRLTRILSVCDRCGSVAFADVAIHGGESLRRDCGKCGRFLGWPRWNGGAE